MASILTCRVESSIGQDDPPSSFEAKVPRQSPEFQLFDDSAVTVVEIKTAEEKAYVENSFSGRQAQDSAGGTGNGSALSPSVLRVAYNLRGCLHSTKSWDCVWGETTTKKMGNMRAAAGASFSTQAVSASASSEYSSGFNRSNTSENLTWEAKGGDTLLCSK
ncbi:uncharacterized protein C8A04DRAFT_30892 [Dichotomopilus funicola]|uniref:Uncharacterized protein n=1 Tax=Dichotomopilus funicola TaxID=1934379 RepID=A0AAN6UYH1_9PEZI|nr:hypothetical protein C8A04DRAFT_30892 [Dichotomopilus funicola]